MHAFRKMVLSIALVLASSCAGIRIVQVRKVRDTPREVKRILVVATVGRENEALRTQIEECFADDLCYLGYEARTSYPDAEFAKSFEMGEQAVLAKIRRDSIDAVMTVAILDWKLERNAMPEEFWCSPYNNYNRAFYCYEQALNNKVSVDGYYSSRHPFFWEFNFYVADDYHLAYCARAKAHDYDNAVHVKAYCDLAVSDMVWRGVIRIKPATN